MPVVSTQEDFKVNAIKPVVINPSIFEGEFLTPSLYGPSSAIAIDRFAPTNLTAPTVSGISRLPSVLTCFPGVWSASPQPDFTYQWYADGVVLVGETDPTITTYLELDQKLLTCVVRAENSVGFDELVSMNSILVQIIEPIEVEGFGIYTLTGLPSKNRVELSSISIFTISGTGRLDTQSVFKLDVYAISFPT